MDVQKLKDTHAIFASVPIPELEQLNINFILNPVVPKGQVWIMSKNDIFPSFGDFHISDFPKPMTGSYLVDYGIPILPKAIPIIGLAEGAYSPRLTVKQKIKLNRKKCQKARIRRKIMPSPSC